SGNTQVQQSLNLRVRKSALARLDTGSYSATVTLAYSRANQPERVATGQKGTHFHRNHRGPGDHPWMS
ncbi:MAG TPA: hypothetical protein VI669_03690, partial [Vicinamibacteria bacterium]